MSSEDTQPAEPVLDLEDSIDVLLEEVESACAFVENPDAVRPEPKRLDQVAEEPAPKISTEGEPATSEDQESAADPENIEQSGDAQETLDALDAVEQNAQSLIEDTIETLLDEPTADEAPSVTQESTLSSEPAGVESAHTELNVDAIEAELDALENVPTPGTIASETGQASAGPETSKPESQATETDALPDADEILEEIVDELSTESPGETSAEIPHTEPLPTAESGEESPPIPPSSSDLVDEAVDDVLDTQSEVAPNEPEHPVTQYNDGATQNTEETQDQSNGIEAASTLADLDATLAGLDDALLVGDFESPDGSVVSANAPQDSDASALLEQLGMDDLEFNEEAASDSAETEEAPVQAAAKAPASATAPDEAPTSNSQPAPSIVSEPDAQPTPQPKPMQPEPLHPEPEVRSIWAVMFGVILMHATQTWATVKEKSGPAFALMILKINKPLKKRPAELRDSIGYLAMWTVLLAAILWVYLAFIRQSPTPTPTQAPTRVLEPGEITDPLRSNDPLP